MDEIRGAGEEWKGPILQDLVRFLRRNPQDVQPKYWGVMRKAYSDMLTESLGTRNKEVRHLRKFYKLEARYVDISVLDISILH